MPEQDKSTLSTLKVEQAELDAIICALRYWQAHDCPDFHGLASQNDTCDALDAAEIDDLVERINCDDEAARTQKLKAELADAIEDARKALTEGPMIQAAGFNEGRLSVMKKRHDESGVTRTAYERAAKDLIRKQSSARFELKILLSRARKAGILAP